jgi:UrcA family protein
MKNLVKTQAKSTAFVLAIGLFAFGAAAVSGSARAVESEHRLTKTVLYGDLNIESDQGAKVLYARLRSAAKDVCQPLEGRNLLGNHWQRCFDHAMDSAVAQVNTARVTALHNRTFNHAAKS